MKLSSYRNHNGEVRIGLKLGEKLADLTGAFEKYLVEDKGVLVQNAVEAARTRMPTSMQQLIERDEEGLADLRNIAAYLEKAQKESQGLYAPSGAKIIYGLEEVKLLKPLPELKRWFNIGINYESFFKNLKCVPPEENKTCMFIVPPESGIGPEETVHLASSAKMCVAELELGVIIGKKGKRLSQTEALDYVWGYTVVSDLCGLDLIREAQGTGRNGLPGGYYLTRSKGFDTYQPFGPYISLKDEIPDPQDVTGEMRVNGEVVVKGHTEDMRCSVRRLMEYLSEDITFYPGDIISSGGMGSGEYSGHAELKSGDVVEAEINKIGILRYYVQ